MATEVGIRDMLEAGVHFGHQTRRWNPKMRRFIHGERSGIYVIDLLKTQTALDARLRDGVPGVARMRALRRDRTRNQWREVPLDEVWGTPYDRLLYTAHAVVVVEINPVGEGAAKTGADEVTGW